MSKNLIRKLSPLDVKSAFYWAHRRATENVENQWCAGNLGFQRARREHFRGTSTEDLVAKEFDIKWTGRFFRREELSIKGHISDVGLIEVKSCPNQNGNLIIESHHTNSAPYVLVSTALAYRITKDQIKMRSNPRLILIGWAWGHEIKQKGKLKLSRGNQTYWLPSHKLRNFDVPEFQEIIKISQLKYGNY